MYDYIIFPAEVVHQAISELKGNRLELCRYEEANAQCYRDEMISRLSASGTMLEFIGYIKGLWVEDNALHCWGDMEDNVLWPLPVSDYTPVPYVNMRTVLHTNDGHVVRTVKDFTFTEIVLVYQQVTRLALQKYLSTRNRATGHRDRRKGVVQRRTANQSHRSVG